MILEPSTEDFAQLLGCINDLVSVAGLPAIWSRDEPRQIGATVLDALFGILGLAFAFVRLNDPEGGPPIEMSRVAPPLGEIARPRDLAVALGLSSDVRAPRPLPKSELQLDGARFRVASVRLGLQGDVGILVVGSQRLDFPVRTEALLIQVATNHAAIGLQRARLSLAQRRIAADLDERVARRTAELSAANEELRREIAERGRVEEALRRSEAFLAQAQRVSSTGSFSWCLDTDRIVFSEELYRIFELEEQSTVTLEQIGTRMHPDDAPLMARLIEQARQIGGNLTYDMRLRMPDGRIKHTRMFGNVIVLPDRRRECIGAMQDVTLRILSNEALDKARTELAYVTRSMSLGALAASIAHEVNQPLSGIITNAGTCMRFLAADPPNVDGALESSRRTIRDGHRAADVIARLRGLFGKSYVAAETVDLNEAAREVISLLSSDLRRQNVSLVLELGDDVLAVAGDRVQLQQVILNLVRNASDAMSDIDDRPRRLRIGTEREAGDRVRLTVQDVGVGFDPSAEDRLFDPFYTTKSDGMGIGLFVSRSIIERHGGLLWAASNAGPGSTFAFSIPCRTEGGSSATRT